jgi:pentatricopeptide repeat domain-containing protein 1
MTWDFIFQPQSQQQTPGKHHLQSLHQPQFHPVLQNNQTMHQSQHAGPYSHNHQNGSPLHLSEISHSHQPSISQQMSCLQSFTGGHVGGRMHMLVSLSDMFCFNADDETFYKMSIMFLLFNLHLRAVISVL